MLNEEQTKRLRSLLEALLDTVEANQLTATSDPILAVAHAWLVRTTEILRALLLLHDHNYDEIAAPLLRSAMEHAVGIAWIQEAGAEGLLSLARGHTKWASDVKRATDAADEHQASPDREDWSRAIDDLLDEIIARELPKSPRDAELHHLQRFQSVGAYDLFVAWLAETSYSHATDASAQPYVVDRGDRYALLSRSRRTDGRLTLLMRCAAIAVMACAAMGKALKADVWSATVARLDEQLGAVLAEAKAGGWTPGPPADEWRNRFDR